MIYKVLLKKNLREPLFKNPLVYLKEFKPCKWKDLFDNGRLL